MRTSPQRPAAPAETPARAEYASVAPQVPGVPWWGATVAALVITIIGVVIDKVASAAPGSPGWGLRIGFFAGAGLAALAVRRRAVFTAMVQPPLILVVVLIPALKFMFSKSIYEAAIQLVNTFPTMAVGTAIALVIGVIRIFAQPLRSKRPAAVRPTADAQHV